MTRSEILDQNVCYWWIGVQIHVCFVMVKKGEIIEFSFDDDECKTSVKSCKVADLFTSSYKALKRRYKTRRPGVMHVEGDTVHVDHQFPKAMHIRRWSTHTDACASYVDVTKSENRMIPNYTRWIVNWSSHVIWCTIWIGCISIQVTLQRM